MAVEVGSIVEGKITGVKKFGAFVALPGGQTGMEHISEVSNEYVQDINTVLHDGDAVKVQVINIAPDGKIALSIKRLLPPVPRQPREGRPAGPRPGGFRNGQEGGRSGGARGAGRDIGPNEALEFEVELIDVTPYVEPAPADSTATAEKPEAAPAK